jgi:micrococcal nuclease
MRRALAVVVLVLLAPACGSDSSGPPGSATVVRVVDGDTLVARVRGADEHVRLIGIDTPETHGPGGLRECFGAEATRHLGELLPDGAGVTLVRDVDARDRYGRLLAYVYRARDELFVNLAMARDGYAAVLTISPNVAHAEQFVAAAAEARQANKGLWSACGGPDNAIP